MDHGPRPLNVLLLVEDEADLVPTLSRALRADGHIVTCVQGPTDTRQFVDRASSDPDSLAGLQAIFVCLHGSDGHATRLMAATHGVDPPCPVLYCCKENSPAERTKAFEDGASDCIGHGFSVAEFLARTQSLIRYAVRRDSEMVYADLVLDLGRQTVKRAGQPVALTAIQFQLLAAFMKHPERPVTAAQLRQAVRTAGSTSLPQHIMSLRKKLEELGPRLIHTAWRTGYVLSEKPLRHDRQPRPNRDGQSGPN